MQNARHLLVRLGLLVLCPAFVVACGDDDDETGSEAGAGNLAAFCEDAPDPTAEVPESYVGSPDHVEDLHALREAATAELRDDLGLIVGHFEDAVDPSDPESQLTENFPESITAAIERVTVYIDANCAR